MMNTGRTALYVAASTLIGAFVACVGTDIINDRDLFMSPSIEITPQSAALMVDGTMQFSAAYFDSLGNEVDGVSFQWRTLNTRVATIDDAGIARALMAGQTMVIAESNGISSDPALLTVVSDPSQVATVEISSDSLTLTVGETSQLSATARNISGGEIQGVNFTWRSSMPTIAAVDVNGLVTSMMSGTAEIFAMTAGVESKATKVQVINSQLTGTFQERPGTNYNISGTAVLERRPSGELLLRFQNDFSSSSGPGLHVFLSNTNRVNAQSRDLGDLQSTSGSQQYDVPSGIDPTTFKWVIIHCVPFNVTFGYAELQ